MNTKKISILALISCFIIVASVLLYNSTISKSKSDTSSNGNTRITELEFESDNNLDLYEIHDAEVTYEAVKKFFNKPEETVIGVTKSVSGKATWNPETKVVQADIRVNLADLQTDNPKRDEHVRGFFNDLNTIFQIHNHIAEIDVDHSFRKEVQGSITINGVTKELTFEVEGTITENSFEASGSADTRISEFGINPPSMMGVFTAADEIKLGFKISGTRITDSTQE